MAGKRWWRAALLAAWWMACAPASAQAWLRWQETPIADQRDPAKLAPPPPPTVRAPAAAVEPVPLRDLATAGATAAGGLAATPPATMPADAHPVAAVTVVSPRSTPIETPERMPPSLWPRLPPAEGAVPASHEPQPAPRFIPVRSRHAVTTSLRIEDAGDAFVPPRATLRRAAPMPMPPSPMPLSALRRVPLPVPLPQPRIQPPSVAVPTPPTRTQQATVASVRIDDIDMPKVRPVPAPALPRRAALAEVLDPAGEEQHPPCVLPIRTPRTAGMTGIAWLPRDAPAEPCPIALDAAALDAQRGSRSVRPEPSAQGELLRSVLHGQ